jgi:hypothetical protein
LRRRREDPLIDERRDLGSIRLRVGDVDRPAVTVEDLEPGESLGRTRDHEHVVVERRPGDATLIGARFVDRERGSGAELVPPHLLETLLLLSAGDDEQHTR